MRTLNRVLIATLASAMSLFVSCKADNQAVNHNYMWFDCEANYATLSSPDSIKFYLSKCKDLGFGNVVVDMKSIRCYLILFLTATKIMKIHIKIILI